MHNEIIRWLDAIRTIVDILNQTFYYCLYTVNVIIANALGIDIFSLVMTYAIYYNIVRIMDLRDPDIMVNS